MRRWGTIIGTALLTAVTCLPATADISPYTVTFTGTLSAVCGRYVNYNGSETYRCAPYLGYAGPFGSLDGTVLVSGDTEPRAFHADLAFFECSTWGVGLYVLAEGTYAMASGPRSLYLEVTSFDTTGLVMAGNAHDGEFRQGLVSASTTFGMVAPDDDRTAGMCLDPDGSYSYIETRTLTAPMTFTAVIVA